MKNFKGGNLSKCCSVFTLIVFFLSQNLLCGIAGAAVPKATTKIKHKSNKYFVSGKRLTLNANVKDEKGVEIARCYFRAQGEADYVFVPMTEAAEGEFEAILPAPSDTTESIDYLFLVVNGEKQIVKTQTFTIAKKDDKEAPAWQKAGSEGNINVSTELAEAPSELAGFSDSITMDVVESTARFGVVAGGLYASTTSAGGTVATTTGTVTATAGVSTAAILGVAALAVAGGAAAAGSGGGGGGSDDGGGSNPTLCNNTTSSGSNTPESNWHDLGQTSGTFDFYYNAISIKDRFIVRYEGATLYDSGCISGSRTVSLSYSGSSSQVNVEIVPNCEGTSGTGWDYRVSCPN